MYRDPSDLASVKGYFQVFFKFYLFTANSLLLGLLANSEKLIVASQTVHRII